MGGVDVIPLSFLILSHPRFQPHILNHPPLSPDPKTLGNLQISIVQEEKKSRDTTTTMAGISYAAVPTGLIKPLVKDLSSKSSFSSSSGRISCALDLADCKSRTVCSAARKETEGARDGKSAFANISTALALAAIVSTAPLTVPSEALADIAGLTPCKESKAFAKREKQSLKKLENSLKRYAPDSAPALAIKATIEKTKKRFENYGKQGLLCGTDGLPHLIVSGDQAHWGEFITPGIIFLYIAGWIGWVGRSYLIAIKQEKKPNEKEIIIDVPLATRLLWRGFIWPVAAVGAFRNGTLIVDDANITVSPR